MSRPARHEDPRDILVSYGLTEYEWADDPMCDCADCRYPYDIRPPWCSCDVCRAVAYFTEGESQHTGHGTLRFTLFRQGNHHG